MVLKRRRMARNLSWVGEKLLTHIIPGTRISKICWKISNIYIYTKCIYTHIYKHIRIFKNSQKIMHRNLNTWTVKLEKRIKTSV